MTATRGGGSPSTHLMQDGTTGKGAQGKPTVSVKNQYAMGTLAYPNEVDECIVKANRETGPRLNAMPNSRSSRY